MIALATKVFLTLFVLLDPVGLAPLFLGLTPGRTSAERERLARRAVLVAGALLLLFSVGGSWLLGTLGITLDAFRIAGGVLLFRISVDMVFAHLERETPEEKDEARARQDISIFPLAIPLIAGPAALASVMILAGEAAAKGPWGPPVALIVGTAAIASVYLALRLASPIDKLLGQTGINVVTRVLGILLAALATQYVADGVRGLLGAK
jgi:multiple antibiotic resistance protein